MQLIQSKIGYLIAGRTNSVSENTSVQLNTFFSNMIDSEDHGDSTQMDHYWNLESSGTDEYAGPLAKEVQATNEKVWEQFRATVETHDDGYYVRLA
ncbi:unnamed protein product [Nippostrongylus brasiliensis]|uniref:DUF4038 domain-containing protein n=1 Tax=Nippostrongylus brasiliensis TaxID=27835 RepID=A0A0N4YQB6_NIPBR|nr:unnamed protein product [Nippostrongylus brasiliensis]